MKTFIFGFGWEIMGVILYFLAWGWLCELLERRVSILKGKIFAVTAISILMLHPFVVNYVVLLFWGLIVGTTLMLWSSTTRDYINDKVPWLTGKNTHAVRLVVLIISFMIFRYSFFHYYPEKMWYNI